MLNLYELKDQYLKLYEEFTNSIDSETGEVDIDIAQRLGEIQASFEEKALKTAYLYRALDDDTDRLTALIDRLTAEKKRLEKRKAAVKDYLTTACLSSGVTKIQGDYANISFRKSSSVVVDNESFLNEDMFNVKIERKPDLKAIKAAIEKAQADGKVFVGAHIEEKQNIQIK